MSTLVRVNMQLKNDNLQKSLRILAAKSEKLPSYLANKACYRIANRARKAMPVVPVPKIASEMAAITPRTSRHHRALTTAERIVIARMHPNSAFNIRTGHVFQLQPPPGVRTTRNQHYKVGASQTRFFDWVAAHAQSMVAARKKSSGFFKVCAHVVQLIFDKGAQSKRPPTEGPESMEAQPGSGNVSRSIGRLAGGMIARDSAINATASFWVTATEPDTKGVPGKAIFRIAQPVWERSLAEEAAITRIEAEKLYGVTIKSAGLVVT